MYDAGRRAIEGELREAAEQARRAIDLGYPAPGLALNLLACVAARGGDAGKAKELLAEAQRRDPQHWVVRKNLDALARGDAGALVARHEFQLLEQIAQPTLPGPLPADFAAWGPPLPAPAKPIGSMGKKLRVVRA